MFPTSQSEGSSVSNIRCTYFALIFYREHSRIRALSLAGRKQAVTSHTLATLEPLNEEVVEMGYVSSHARQFSVCYDCRGDGPVSRTPLHLAWIL